MKKCDGKYQAASGILMNKRNNVGKVINRKIDCTENLNVPEEIVSSHTGMTQI